MSTAKFFVVLAIGLGLIAAQVVCARIDGFFSIDQIRSVHRMDRAYSLLQHGGMWADLILVTPIVAYLVGRYELEYLSKPGLWILVGIAAAILLVVGPMFVKFGLAIPEAHTHDGMTTAAGKIHGLYAATALWICILFYSGLASVRLGPDIIGAPAEMLCVSIGLTIWAILGVMKFSPVWKWDATAIAIVAAEVVLIWGVTIRRFPGLYP